MSKWRSGNIKMQCSIEILRKILLDIMPEWENNIQSSETGGIPFQKGYGQDSQAGCHVVISRGITQVGFRKDADDSWSYEGDTDGLPMDAYPLEGKIKQSLAAIKIKRLIRESGKEISDVKHGRKRKLKIVVPVKEKYRF